MAARKSRIAAKNVSDETEPKIAINSLGHNEFEGEIGGKGIRPNASEAETAENALETLGLADFVELAELPVPSIDSEGFTNAEQTFEAFAASRFGWLLEGLDFADETNKTWSYCESVNLRSFLTALRQFLQDAVAEPRPSDICMLFATSRAHRWIVGADGRLNPVAALDSPAARLAARFKALVEGVEMDRFRRCAYAKCGRIFYARNRRQRCCSKRCSNAVLQREWYKRHGKADVYLKGEKP
jgi:predicted RNA-binding Zn ribbon-like protein